METNILAVVFWVVTTNWVSVTPDWIYPQHVFGSVSIMDGGSESATLTSNRVMRFDVGGESREVILESVPFLITNRSWKTEKVYTGGPSEKICFPKTIVCTNLNNVNFLTNLIRYSTINKMK